MGWMYTNKLKGLPIKKFFEERFNYDHGKEGSGKILICRTHTYARESYMAYQVVDRHGNSKVIALVCLLGFRPHDHYNFGYKDMDENMGPCSYNCPKDILDLLSPTDNDTAKAWRHECLKRVERRNPVKTGAIIRFKKPIDFKNGDQCSVFLVKNARKGWFEANGRGYKIKRECLRRESWEVLDPENASPEELPLMLGLHPSLDMGVERRLRPPDPASRCPVSNRKCEDYDDCDNRQYCHLK